jgi:Zinc-finger of C2H2 type
MELDPTQFLAQDDDDDDASRQHQVSMEEGPPILTSLGLTHINAVNPYNLAASDNEGADETTIRTGSTSTPLSGRTPALCSVCDMSFSNRANARRHERNIHGVNNNPLNAQPIGDTSTNLGASGSGLIRPITLGSAPKVAPPIFRQRVFGRKTQPEVYDYSNPAKYRHLLTPMRLAFILKNMEFLEQIQTMMCKCCNKQFPSYKFFMGHMRKKYRTLPRQVCFRCLKQFETKGQFIGHLKRKDCVNLYQIVMADDSISKENLTDVKQRLGPKDTLQNRTYGCRQCTKTFRYGSKCKK